MSNPAKRILLVDDDPKVANLLRLALSEYEIRITTDGESALKVAEEFQPDLFIVDLILPGMRGTTLALLLQEKPASAEKPIFLISGLIEAPPGSQEPVRISGLTAFRKPFSLEIIQKHVRLHLQDPEGGRAAVQELKLGRIMGEK